MVAVERLQTPLWRTSDDPRSPSGIQQLLGAAVENNSRGRGGEGQDTIAASVAAAAIAGEFIQYWPFLEPPPTTTWLTRASICHKIIGRDEKDHVGDDG